MKEISVASVYGRTIYLNENNVLRIYKRRIVNLMKIYKTFSIYKLYNMGILKGLKQSKIYRGFYVFIKHDNPYSMHFYIDNPFDENWYVELKKIVQREFNFKCEFDIMTNDYSSCISILDLNVLCKSSSMGAPFKIILMKSMSSSITKIDIIQKSDHDLLLNRVNYEFLDYFKKKSSKLSHYQIMKSSKLLLPFINQAKEYHKLSLSSQQINRFINSYINVSKKFQNPSNFIKCKCGILINFDQNQTKKCFKCNNFVKYSRNKCLHTQKNFSFFDTVNDFNLHIKSELASIKNQNEQDQKLIGLHLFGRKYQNHLRCFNLSNTEVYKKNSITNNNSSSTSSSKEFDGNSDNENMCSSSSDGDSENNNYSTEKEIYENPQEYSKKFKLYKKDYYQIVQTEKKDLSDSSDFSDKSSDSDVNCFNNNTINNKNINNSDPRYSCNKFKNLFDESQLIKKLSKYKSSNSNKLEIFACSDYELDEDTYKQLLSTNKKIISQFISNFNTKHMKYSKNIKIHSYIDENDVVFKIIL